MKRIISLWIPRIATDLASLTKPRLHNRAFALTIQKRAKVMLFATNLEAEKIGIMPGMSLADARDILPNISVESANPNADKMVLEKIRSLCERYSPWTSIDDLENKKETEKNGFSSEIKDSNGAGIWIDVTGCTHLFGGEEKILADIVERIRRLGFSAHAAIAETKRAAWALSHYGKINRDGWIRAKPGALSNILSPLPISALCLAPSITRKLDILGLRTIGNLLSLPRTSLAARYGETIVRQLDLTLGKVSEPVSYTRYEQPLFARITFTEPISNLKDIEAALEKLLITLCHRMMEELVGARRLIFTLYRIDGTAGKSLVNTAYPVRNVVDLARLFNQRLNDIDPGFGIEEATLFIEKSDTLNSLQMETSEFNSIQDFTSLINRLINKFGSERVLRPQFLESHLPERTGALYPFTKENSPNATPKINIPRPVRLLRPPEEIETITIITAADTTPPTIFRWRKVLHQVIRTEGPERIASEWWGQEHPNTRDYFQVENSNGQRFWIFKKTDNKTVTPRWYVHGLFA